MTLNLPLRVAYLSLFLTFFVRLSLSAQDLAINEVMASNSSAHADEDGDYSDWIELHNYGASTISLEGYGLSDNYADPFKWVFPAISLEPNAYILVWASGKNRNAVEQPLHTNFNIGADGEEIILTHPDSLLVDELTPTPIPADISYGRLPDGTGDWVFFSEITPGAPNSENVYILPPEAPVFSHPSGFYTEAFSLSLSHPDPEADIIYTIDGSEPSAENLSGTDYPYKNQYPQNPGQAFGELLTNSYTSHTYSTPLAINDRSSEPNKLAAMSSTWHFDPDYLPDDPIKKATVVKARAVVNGVSGKAATNTYFVSTSGAHSSTLPIVSISLNEDALFDYNDGIHVAGVDFDNWRTQNPGAVTTGHVPANYRRRGIETEKPAVFQYFIDGEEVLKQNIGLRLHGSFSKSAQNKTFRLYARAEYDEQNRFDYPFFGPENSSSFKRLILRNSGNDVGNEWIGFAQVPTISPAVYFRDGFIQKMVAHLRFDTQDYLPTITYVNGEYWGLLNLRERYDHHYLERKYAVTEEQLDYLGGNAEVNTGEDVHYVMMRDYIAANNLTSDEAYDYVKTLMDIDNFMDYQIAQIYARNTDWPGNNIEYFRKRTAQYEPDAPYGQDGRWRWLMFDADHGFGWSGGESYTHNSLQNASGDLSRPRLIMRQLLENQEFRNSFINRYADLMNTAFTPERLIALIDEMADNIEEEIPIHRARWNTLHNWEDHVQQMRTFAAERPAYARSHVRSRFGINSNITATLNVSDASQGYIQINTVEIKESTPGIPANPYPWEGVYFHNIPITVIAIPRPGFRFSHWSGASSSGRAKITLTPMEDFSLEAHFVPEESGTRELLYFWLLDSNIPNDTPLSQINASYSLDDQDATLTFQSVFGTEYPYAEGHPNWRKGSLERRNAPTPLNYLPQANENISYEDVEMRGLQVKQPFLGNGAENTLIFTFSTENRQDIRLSFAAKDEDAAKELKVEYFDPKANEWTHENATNATLPLSEDYQKLIVDFTHVSLASDNPSFKVRVRFGGVDMAKDNGDRVTFNNFAIEGNAYSPITQTEENMPLEEKAVFLYPNPAANHVIIQAPASLGGAEYRLYDLYGRVVVSGVLQGQKSLVALDHLPAGIYFVKVGNNEEHTFKLIRSE